MGNAFLKKIGHEMEIHFLISEEEGKKVPGVE